MTLFFAFSDKSVQALKDSVRLTFDAPGMVFKDWLADIDKSWKGQKDITNICLPSIVKMTYMFCMSSLPHASPSLPDSALVQRVFLNVPAR